MGMCRSYLFVRKLKKVEGRKTFHRFLPAESKRDSESKRDFLDSRSILSTEISTKIIFLLLNEVECNEVAHMLYTDHTWM